MNVYLENESSPMFRELVAMVEAFTEDEWLDPEMERRMWELDDALSNVLKMKEITHYTIPFKDRPEISILYKGSDFSLNRDVLDEH
jgi:hypothetical protein